MTDRLNWRAHEHGFSKQDCVLAENMATAAKDQILVRNEKEKLKRAKTYQMPWHQMLQYYLENQDTPLAHACEFEHENCATEPNGYCVMVSGLFSHAMYAESAILAALHEEWLQELLGHKKVNEFFHRLKKFDTKLMPDLNQALFDAGYTRDLVEQYMLKGWDYVDSWIMLRGPCPLVRSKPEFMPAPPCPFD